MVEILINYLQTGDWRTSFQIAIPMRKVNNKPNLNTEYNYLNIRTEEQLLALPIIRLPKFEFKNKLDRYCVQHKMKLTFQHEEHAMKKEMKEGEQEEKEISRFTVRALVDGKVMGEGKGGNMRIAASYASWHALNALGVFSNVPSTTAAEEVSE